MNCGFEYACNVNLVTDVKSLNDINEIDKCFYRCTREDAEMPSSTTESPRSWARYFKDNTSFPFIALRTCRRNQQLAEIYPLLAHMFLILTFETVTVDLSRSKRVSWPPPSRCL